MQVASAHFVRSRPRVLLLATGKWISTARLAMALRSLGCDVDLMSVKGHPALLAGAVQRHFAYKPLRPIQSVTFAVTGSHPDALIPIDEQAVLHLEELAATNHDADFRALLNRSLGDPQILPVVRSRMDLLEIARQQGVAVPDTVAVPAVTDVAAALDRLGTPLVLKADATAGGQGVRMVHTLAQAQSAWRRLHRPPSLPRAAWRAVARSEWTHLRTWSSGHQRGVSGQKFLANGERTAMALTHRGSLCAFVCMEVVRTWKDRGPSSVLRLVVDPVMEQAMRRVAERLCMSGLCGFDFMLSDAGEPLLIELNPRPTQLSHLPLGPQRDLVAAYVRHVLGHEVADRPAATDRDLIALFPQELQREPQSEFIAQAYHDVPWESPSLMKYALKPLPPRLTEDLRWKG